MTIHANQRTSANRHDVKLSVASTGDRPEWLELVLTSAKAGG